MKRKYKDVQRLLDEAVLYAIKIGSTDNAHLKQVVRQTLTDHLTITGQITIAYLLDALSGVELSSVKQRLREAGLVELSKGNEAVLVENLTPADAEVIDSRRASHIAGELKTRILFNQRHGRTEQAEEAARQLSLFDFSDAEEEEASPVGQVDP